VRVAGDEQQVRDEQLREEITGRFAPDRLLEVQLVRELAGSPESEARCPNTLHVRLIPRGPDAYNPVAGQAPRRGAIPSAVYRQVVDAFHRAHADALKQLGRDLAGRVPERLRLSVAYGGYTHDWDFDPPLTPVMARLDRTDLETLDALIAAGCAPNRADAIRWALARVRERPAYLRLVERVREVQALRTEL
jgi:hypothetical protein